jgi:hypothetical protein
MALAGVGVSLAGFAGVIAALSRRPGERSAVLAYRITNIVFLGLTLAIAAYATLVAFTVSGDDVALAVRVGTVLVLLPYLRGFRELRPGPAWPDQRQRRMGLVALVIGPGLIFYNTIRDAASAERRESDLPAPPTTGPVGGNRMPTSPIGQPGITARRPHAWRMTARCSGRSAATTLEFGWKCVRLVGARGFAPPTTWPVAALRDGGRVSLPDRERPREPLPDAG